MLESVKISRAQSGIREQLAALVGKADPSEDELRTMADLDRQYQANETRFRAALVAEDGERREAGAELETRGGREWQDMVRAFELRQAIVALDEGRQLSGPTAEVVSELRGRGGFRGIPIPFEALETRAGETVASGTPDPIVTRPTIDRLFPSSASAAMGVQAITIDSGAIEWPVTSSAITAGWANGETANVAGPTAYTAGDKALKPEQSLGIQVRLTRKAMLQSGPALEAAVRRDLNGTIGAELDKAVFLGTGSSGQPLGLIPGSSSDGSTGHNILSVAVSAPADWAAFRAAVVAFMTAHAAGGPGAVRALIRPELWAFMDATTSPSATPRPGWLRPA